MPKISRPARLKGTTHRIETGCGKMYVIVNRDEKTNEILEVFASLGKGGGCAKAQSEAITRAITLGLRYGVPLAEYTKQLCDIKCHTPGDYYGEDDKKSRVESCADAIAKVLQAEEQAGLK